MKDFGADVKKKPPEIAFYGQLVQFWKKYTPGGQRPQVMRYELR